MMRQAVVSPLSPPTTPGSSDCRTPNFLVIFPIFLLYGFWFLHYENSFSFFFFLPVVMIGFIWLDLGL